MPIWGEHTVRILLYISLLSCCALSLNTSSAPTATTPTQPKTPDFAQQQATQMQALKIGRFLDTLPTTQAPDTGSLLSRSAHAATKKEYDEVQRQTFSIPGLSIRVPQSAQESARSMFPKKFIEHADGSVQQVTDHFTMALEPVIHPLTDSTSHLMQRITQENDALSDPDELDGMQSLTRIYNKARKHPSNEQEAMLRIDAFLNTLKKIKAQKITFTTAHTSTKKTLTVDKLQELITTQTPFTLFEKQQDTETLATPSPATFATIESDAKRQNQWLKTIRVKSSHGGYQSTTEPFNLITDPLFIKNITLKDIEKAIEASPFKMYYLLVKTIVPFFSFIPDSAAAGAKALGGVLGLEFNKETAAALLAELKRKPEFELLKTYLDEFKKSIRPELDKLITDMQAQLTTSYGNPTTAAILNKLGPVIPKALATLQDWLDARYTDLTVETIEAWFTIQTFIRLTMTENYVAPKGYRVIYDPWSKYLILWAQHKALTFLDTFCGDKEQYAVLTERHSEQTAAQYQTMVEYAWYNAEQTSPHSLGLARKASPANILQQEKRLYLLQNKKLAPVWWQSESTENSLAKLLPSDVEVPLEEVQQSGQALFNAGVIYKNNTSGTPDVTSPTVFIDKHRAKTSTAASIIYADPQNSKHFKTEAYDAEKHILYTIEPATDLTPLLDTIETELLVQQIPFFQSLTPSSPFNTNAVLQLATTESVLDFIDILSKPHGAFWITKKVQTILNTIPKKLHDIPGAIASKLPTISAEDIKASLAGLTDSLIQTLISGIVSASFAHMAGARAAGMVSQFMQPIPTPDATWFSGIRLETLNIDTIDVLSYAGLKRIKGKVIQQVAAAIRRQTTLLGDDVITNLIATSIDALLQPGTLARIPGFEAYAPYLEYLRAIPFYEEFTQNDLDHFSEQKQKETLKLALNIAIMMYVQLLEAPEHINTLYQKEQQLLRAIIIDNATPSEEITASTFYVNQHAELYTAFKKLQDSTTSPTAPPLDTKKAAQQAKELSNAQRMITQFTTQQEKEPASDHSQSPIPVDELIDQITTIKNVSLPLIVAAAAEKITTLFLSMGGPKILPMHTWRFYSLPSVAEAPATKQEPSHSWQPLPEITQESMRQLLLTQKPDGSFTALSIREAEKKLRDVRQKISTLPTQEITALSGSTDTRIQELFKLQDKINTLIQQYPAGSLTNPTYKSFFDTLKKEYHALINAIEEYQTNSNDYTKQAVLNCISALTVRATKAFSLLAPPADQLPLPQQLKRLNEQIRTPSAAPINWIEVQTGLSQQINYLKDQELILAFFDIGPNILYAHEILVKQKKELDQQLFYIQAALDNKLEVENAKIEGKLSVKRQKQRRITQPKELEKISAQITELEREQAYIQEILNRKPTAQALETDRETIKQKLSPLQKNIASLGTYYTQYNKLFLIHTLLAGTQGKEISTFIESKLKEIPTTGLSFSEMKKAIATAYEEPLKLIQPLIHLYKEFPTTFKRYQSSIKLPSQDGIETLQQQLINIIDNIITYLNTLKTTPNIFIPQEKITHHIQALEKLKTLISQRASAEVSAACAEQVAKAITEPTAYFADIMGSAAAFMQQGTFVEEKLFDTLQEATRQDPLYITAPYALSEMTPLSDAAEARFTPTFHFNYKTIATKAAKLALASKICHFFVKERNEFIVDTLLENTELFSGVLNKTNKTSRAKINTILNQLKKHCTYVPFRIKLNSSLKHPLLYMLFYELINFLETQIRDTSVVTPLNKLISSALSDSIREASSGMKDGKNPLAKIETDIIHKIQVGLDKALYQHTTSPIPIPLTWIGHLLLGNFNPTAAAGSIFTMVTSRDFIDAPILTNLMNLPPGINILATGFVAKATNPNRLESFSKNSVIKHLIPALRGTQLVPDFYDAPWFIGLKKFFTAYFTMRNLDQLLLNQLAQHIAKKETLFKSLLKQYDENKKNGISNADIQKTLEKEILAAAALPRGLSPLGALAGKLKSPKIQQLLQDGSILFWCRTKAIITVQLLTLGIPLLKAMAAPFTKK